MTEQDITSVAEDIEFLSDLSPAIFQKSPDAIFIVLAETGQIKLVNDQAEFLTGYHRSELRGKIVDMLLPDARRGHHKDLREGYISDPRVRQMGADLNLTLKTKSGRIIPVDIMLAPVSTAQGLFIIATLRRRQEHHNGSAATV